MISLLGDTPKDPEPGLENLCPASSGLVEPVSHRVFQGVLHTPVTVGHTPWLAEEEVES